VHLVAIRRGSERDFERLHVEATRNVLDAARRAGATRFLHMSAHGVRHDGTPYQRTKWQAEGLVRASGLAWTIFRPTFVTGPAEGAAGSADHEFAALLKRTHALPNFRGGQLRLQPIAKRDVADAFAAALERPAAVGQAYELAGPDVLSWEEYARALGREVGVAPHLAPAPEGLLLAAAGVLGGFSWFPASKDELRMLLEDHVADPAPAQRDLGLQLTPFAQALHEALQTSPSGPVRRA
jgi:NADH dehydrogenase